MANTMMSMHKVVEVTGLNASQIRHRMRMMGIVPEKLNRTQYLFTKSQIKKIARYPNSGRWDKGPQQKATPPKRKNKK